MAPLQVDVQVEAVGHGRDNRTVQRIAVHERVLVRVEIAQPAPPPLEQVEPLAPAWRAVLPWLPILIRTVNAGVSHHSGGQAREDHCGGQ